MSLPRYYRYKPSGVEHLGDLPEDWQVLKLAYGFDMGSGTTPKSDNPDFYDGGTIPWVNTGDLNDGTLLRSGKYITTIAAKTHSTLRLYPKMRSPLRCTGRL